jgi:hypothetical protein
MFGANDNTQLSNDDPAMLDNVKQLASEPVDQVAPSQPQFMASSAPSQPDPSFTTANPAMTATPDPVSADEPQINAIAEPAQGFSSSPMPDPVTATDPEPLTEDTPADDTPIAAAMAPADPNQLAGMKQQALEHLEPLVGHLDQSPEEAFKTTMMMIQANDNHTLLEKALEEAKKIEDDKARANAMLDIINEINYFSQAAQQ